MIDTIGVTEARIATPPRRDLGPATSLGFECIRFAQSVLGVQLDPWQQWFLVHALETNEDGTFRFRTVLLMVARQNGKTEVAKILILWLMYTGRVRLALGAAQSLGLARETWMGAYDLAMSACPETRSEVVGLRKVNGEQEFTLANGARYAIRAATRGAGRGLSVGFLFFDELREQRDMEAWRALSATTAAMPMALTLLTSNAGDDNSALLNTMRQAAMGDAEDLGIFEWSAPEGCALDDRDGWRWANPSLGHGRLSMRVLEAALESTTPGVFRTEHLCQRVTMLDAAIPAAGWKSGADRGGSLADFREELTVGFDVSPDRTHASLYAAAAVGGGRVRVEAIAAWSDMDVCHAELGGLLDSVGARVEAWFPTGPGAEFAYIFEGRKRAQAVAGGKVAQACAHFAGLAAEGRLLHGDDPLLNVQVGRAGRQGSGDGFRFTRRGGPVDALYACAGATHVALTVPVVVKRKRVVI